MKDEPMRPSERLFKVATALNPLAGTIDLFFDELIGERVAFVMAVCVDKSVQYVANVERYQGTELLRDLLARWDAGRADIPGTINPELKAPMLGYDVSFKHRDEPIELQVRNIAAQSVKDAEERARIRLSVPDAWHCSNVVEAAGTDSA